MKLLIVLALVAVSQAVVLHHPGYYYPRYYYGLGVSNQYKNQDIIGNYNFGYNEDHLTGGSYRRELGSGLGNVKVGSYGLREADGNIRHVDYVADGAGYRVKMRTTGDIPEKTAADVEVSKIKPIEVKPVEVKPVVQYAPHYYNWALPQYSWGYPYKYVV
ncbi:cuticle protein 14-like [Tachypleus tridentatus]|uniref:cuticle protein 14-like n=1 Tax=Tachypleus tridentatus TaxID=6853 RepID=UPI003FD57131